MSDFDFTTQQEELIRRQKLIDALTQGQPMQGGQGSSGAFWNSLNNGIGQLKAKGMQEQLTADTAAFRGKYGEALGRESNQFLDTANGKPPVPAGGDGVGPPVPAVQPNPREAVIRAMTSQLPEMQAMGKAAFSNLSKPTAIEKFGHDPKTVVGPDGKPTLIVMGDQGTAKQVQGYEPDHSEWSPLQELGKGSNGQPVMGWVNKRTNEPKPLSQGQVINNNLDMKGTSEVQKEVLPALKSARETILNAQSNLQAAQRVMGLIDDPQVQSGFGSSVMNGLGSLGASLGFNGSEGVAKTQALATEMAAKTLSQTKQLTGAISDKEKPFLEQVVAGKIDFTPQVIKHVAALAIQANHNAVMEATTQHESASKVTGMEEAAKVYPLPKAVWNVPQKNGQDDPAFTLDSRSKLQYDGSYLSGATPNRRASDVTKPRKVISFDDFMKGP